MWIAHMFEMNSAGKWNGGIQHEYQYKTEKGAQGRVSRLVGELCSEPGDWSVKSYEKDGETWHVTRDLTTGKRWISSYFLD